MIGPKIRQSGRAAFTLVGVLALVGTACDYQFGSLFGPGGWGYDVETRPVWIEVTGTVTAARDGRPVAGATVQDWSTYEDAEFGRGGTDAEGRYTLLLEYSCVAESTCSIPQLELFAHLDRFERGLAPRRALTPDQELLADQDTARVTVNFALPHTLPVTVKVVGRVGRASSGAAIEGAQVAVDWAHKLPFELPQPSTTTGADGQYTLIADHVCAIEGPTCRMSFAVRAEWDGASSAKWFEDVEVSGDTLTVAAGFHDF